MNPPADGARFEQARQLFMAGVGHHEAGRFEQAEACLLASLQALPGRASTLANLGAARLALGRPEQALEDLDASLAVEPSDAQTWCHRARACAALRRTDEALQGYARALELDPGLAAARYHRAALLASTGRPGLAHADLLPLLDPHRREAADAWLLAGQVLQALQRDPEALEAYHTALALDASLPRAHALAGQLLVALGRADEARDVYRRGIEQGPEPALNRYLLAGLDGAEDAPPASPQAYVRALFDPYAADFEGHLLDGLRYRGHDAVARAARRHGAGRRWQHVLDLGCGTGLCGRALRDDAERIDGVDLSPTMVDAARGCGAYAQLAQADVVDHLSRTPARHDLVLSADVFIYIGDLDPVFAGVRRVLVPGGLFVFSVETLDEAEEAAASSRGYRLRRSLRYGHTRSAVQQLAARHGMDLVGWEAFVVREEQRRPVPGAVATLRARGTDAISPAG